jgi:sugar-specific transcriptional regulator TrmB
VRIETMNARDEAVSQLQSLGMSGYEAKAYLALIAASEPLTGYEVAKKSGVPRSAIYETLDKLLTNGSAFEVRTSADSVSHVALPPDSLLRRLRDQFQGSLDILDGLLPTLTETAPRAVSHHLNGPAAVLARAIDVIHRARDEILLLASPEELTEFEPALRAAETRDVRITVVTAGTSEISVGTSVNLMVPQQNPSSTNPTAGPRLVILVADGAELVVGGLEPDGVGLFSDNPPVVAVATELVRHNVALQLLAAAFGAEKINDVLAADPVLGPIFAAAPSAAGTLLAALRQGTEGSDG